MERKERRERVGVERRKIRYGMVASLKQILAYNEWDCD